MVCGELEHLGVAPTLGHGQQQGQTLLARFEVLPVQGVPGPELQPSAEYLLLSGSSSRDRKKPLNCTALTGRPWLSLVLGRWTVDGGRKATAVMKGQDILLMITLVSQASRVYTLEATE